MLSQMSLLIGQRLLTRTTSFQVTKCQFSRLASNSINSSLRKGLVFNSYKHSKVYGIYSIRYESTGNASIEEILGETANNMPQSLNVPEIPIVAKASNTEWLNEIPDPPVPVLEEVIQQAVQLNAHGDPTFSSIGLGGYGPVGLLQYYFEWFYVTTNLPWWTTILITSLIFKVVLFPCTVRVQRNSVKMHNILPEMVELQQNITEYKKTGNVEGAAISSYELQELLKKNNVSFFPYANFVKIGLHFPIFLALREMAILPLESLKTGGLWWFTDLTTTDPYYVLPICTSITLYLVTNYAMKTSGQSKSPNQYLLYAMRVIPFISFLFSMHFPTAVLCHWATSNLVTLMENKILQVPVVRKYFNIPSPKKHETSKKLATNKPKRSFYESFNDSWENMQIANKLAAQARADMIRFNEAGKEPLRKTYKYNPKAPPTSISAMKK